MGLDRLSHAVLLHSSFLHRKLLRHRRRWLRLSEYDDHGRSDDHDWCSLRELHPDDYEHDDHGSAVQLV